MLRDNLTKRNWACDPKCSFCEDPESANHSHTSSGENVDRQVCGPDYLAGPRLRNEATQPQSRPRQIARGRRGGMRKKISFLFILSAVKVKRNECETTMPRLLPPLVKLPLLGVSPFPAFPRPPPPPRPLHIFIPAAVAGRGGAGENTAAASGTTARERRLVKVREERRRREHDREHTYPGWARYAASTRCLGLFVEFLLFVSIWPSLLPVEMNPS